MKNDSGMVTVVDRLAFPEAPRWHDDALWFSDFYTHKVHRIGSDGILRTVAEVPGQPSGLGWLPDGRLLVVSMEDRRLLRLDGGQLATAADLSPLAAFPCNDMVVDAQGRAYIGNFGFDMFNRAAPQPTALFLVTPDGKARIAADGLLFPNGCVITPDGGTLIVAETFGKRLTAFDIADDGSLHRRRLWADLGNACPDGICLDAEGAVWIASPPTAEFLRVFEGGRIAARVAVTQQAIACTLGGPGRHTLYVVTGRVSKAPRALAERNGRIAAIQVEVPGAGLP
ncbi:MAG TPA: SMP-30/gluconolactonase/LRE family protein [Noviherbaspirillum sp.]|uniref:SMP-30/gluconolactonase/LRE family protein n=1 Tax=Noviherbaspirillum sp. TaxID=1926288 RepID=UPI002D63FFE0|nr:SMP-30/gluconolactonase/LRE family protein [Noviherbaspirillum sp.]HYD94808.1 SMP-30/gluconolactonase/LRE family protein [Noviherbaspirillum sp.]